MCSSNSQIIIFVLNVNNKLKKNNYFHFVTPAIKTITLNVLISILMKKIL